MAKQKQPEAVKQPFIINDLTLVAPDRQRKDVGKLKSAVVSAEQILYPNRVQLYDLYHDVVSMDAHLQGIIRKRIDSVLNKKLNFKNGQGEHDQDVANVMRSEPGRELITKLVESKIWGVSGVEFKVGTRFALEEIPRKHIKPEKGIISKTQYGLSEQSGYAYEDLPFVWVIGGKRDLGLLLSCSMYALYKRGVFADWAQYVEIFGQPVRIVRYDAYDTQTKAEVRKVLNESGSALAIMLPKQAEFEMLDGKASNGDGKLQETLKNACNDEMSIAILGNSQTTTSDSGSGYAQAKVHGDQQDEITASDLIFVENLLSSEKFLEVLRSYGYNVEGGRFEYELEINLAKLKERMEIDLKISEKVPVGDDYWYETYGIPKPENYDELKAKQEERANAMLKLAQQVPAEPKAKGKGAGPSLIDTEEPTLPALIYKAVADFFDRARP